MKYLYLLAVLAFIYFLLFPRAAPRIFRRAGRSVGDLGRLGQELATGEEVDKSPLARYETKAGQLVAQRLLHENPLSADPGLQEQIRSVGDRLREHSIRKQIPYRFRPVDSDEPNAFAVPGGNVFVTGPLIQLCAGDVDSLACVLAHEVIHIDQRHAVKNLAASTALKTGLNIFTLGRGAILAKIAGGMQSLLVNGYRQDQELEADLYGARLARLAGYDPHGMIRLLERLKQLRPDGKGPLSELFQYFRSHPPIDDRINNLARNLG